MGRSTVVIELADDARFARDLSAGGVFIDDCSLTITDECELIVRGAHEELHLAARVVYVDAERGAGLELIGFSPELKAQLAALEPLPSRPAVMPRGTRDDAVPVTDAPWDDMQIPVEDASAWHGIDDWLGVDDAARVRMLKRPATAAAPDATWDNADSEWDLGEIDLAPRAPNDAHSGHTEPLTKISLEEVEDSGDRALAALGEATEDDAPEGEDFETRTEELPRPGDDSPRREKLAKNVNERLRGLNLAAQLKLAATGELHERLVLERLYGKNVWETLLRNPRLSAPEVARIARMGALPKPLLELIVGNPGWLAAPEVRRALLANPRLAMDQIVKVLRMLPKHELKLACVQSAYPQPVRQAAKMLMRD